MNIPDAILRVEGDFILVSDRENKILLSRAAALELLERLPALIAKLPIDAATTRPPMTTETATPLQMEPPSHDPASTQVGSTFRAADIVHHIPSGEDWVLAIDEENGRVQPCGWPNTMAEAKDCTLTTAATDAHRLVMLEEWAAAGKGCEHERDSRTRTARHQISPENA